MSDLCLKTLLNNVQLSVARLLVKRLLNPDGSDSVFDDAIVVDDVNHSSPTHYIDAATSAAKQYLPQPAGDAVELLGHTVGAVVTSRVASSVASYAGERVQATHDAVTARTNQILGSVQSGWDSLSERAAAVRAGGKGRRMSQGSSHGDDAGGAGPPPVQTPRFMQAYDQFGFEDLGGGSGLSRASSVEDVSRGNLAEASSPARSISGGGGSIVEEEDDLPDIELVSADLASEASRSLMAGDTVSNDEEELCQLVINILFTIMWRGMQGASPEVIKERGCVIACVNMLGLNHELYRSHLELKRQLVEQCIQAVLSDHREAAGQAQEGHQAQVVHVMQWVYDLVVLDQSKNFEKKVTETLLDGVLALLERLPAFGSPEFSQDDESLCKMALDVLLKVAEEADDVSLRSMATAKIHAFILTRASGSAAESAYLLERLVTALEAAMAGDDEDSYSFMAPLIKGVLDKSRDVLKVSTQLPSLDLRQQTPVFFAAFRDFLKGDEWRYFATKRLAPLTSEYRAGLLADLPREMDVFWAECYELSKVATHRRSREVGESKLRFQAKYVEPFASAVKAEAARYQNGLSQQKSHQAFIRKRWDISKRLVFGPRGAWHDPNTAVTTEYWKLSPNETIHRMRLKLIPNSNFNAHLEASAARDNVKGNGGGGQRNNLLQLQISKDALTSHEEHAEDCLTEEDLRAIAKEQVSVFGGALHGPEPQRGRRTICALGIPQVKCLLKAKGKGKG
jgi:hypothetical protein